LADVVRTIIGFLLVAILFPIAMTQVVTASTGAWNTAVQTVFAVLLPVLVVIGIAYGFLKFTGEL
jgi:hypothetical protein